MNPNSALLPQEFPRPTNHGREEKPVRETLVVCRDWMRWHHQLKVDLRADRFRRMSCAGTQQLARGCSFQRGPVGASLCALRLLGQNVRGATCYCTLKLSSDKGFLASKCSIFCLVLSSTAGSSASIFIRKSGSVLLGRTFTQ